MYVCVCVSLCLSVCTCVCDVYCVYLFMCMLCGWRSEVNLKYLLGTGVCQLARMAGEQALGVHLSLPPQHGD